MSYLVMELRGRLGNNLWQFASGLGIARAVGARLCFDRHRVPDADLLLPHLIGPSYVPVTAAQLRRVGIATHRRGALGELARATLRRAHDAARSVRHRPSAQIMSFGPGDETGPEPDALHLPVYVAGYFHDERNFAGVADEVAAAIRWPQGTPTLPGDLRATVAVSFRRGDYNVFGAGLPLDYYDRAMDMLSDTVGSPTFVLFGDDPAFVDLFAERAERRGHSAVSGLRFGHDPITQLKLLSECEHAILANSSFAWWATWLGDRRGDERRMVIAPAGWGPRRDGWIALEETPGVDTVYNLSDRVPAAAWTDT